MTATIARCLPRPIPAILAGLVLTLLMSTLAAAQTVTTEAELRAALASAVPGSTITFGANITLTADLPNVGTSVTIDGAGFTLSGNNQFRGLLVAGFASAVTGGPPPAVPITVAIQNLTIANTVATGGTGGAGGPGGGGGAGMGGALFIGDLAAVSVSNVSLSSNSAVGGNGGAGGSLIAGGGGGGGMGGNGGTGAGGGGGVGIGANGGNSNTAGSPGIITGSTNSGGGGAGGNPFVNGGGGGGLGSGNIAGFGGGGGGESTSTPGTPNAGFGGGSGGGGTTSSSSAAIAGYGGGGGGNIGPFGPNPGGTFGGVGGTGTTGGIGGGGGAGLGGAIFIQQSSPFTSGGSLTIDGAFSINGASVSAGTGAAGATNGSALGSGIFIQGNSQFGLPSLNFQPASGNTVNIANNIVDELGQAGTIGGAAVNMFGAGTLVLGGNNLYSGGTNLSSGTLSVSSDANLGLAGTNLFVSGGTFQITGSSAFSRDLLLGTGPQTVSVTPGQSATWNGVISASDSPSGLNVTGGGTLNLTNANNSYSLGTSISGNSKVSVAVDGALGAFSALDPTIGTVSLGDALSGGTLGIDATSVGNAFSSIRAITLQSGGGTIETVGATTATLGGAIDGVGGLTKSGAGLLTLNGSNSYSGGTIVNDGILQAGSSTAFGTSRSLTVGSTGTADFGGFNQTFFSIAGTGSIGLNGAATLSVGGDNSNSTFGGTISGNGSLIKDGTGTLALSGTNTFTGGIALTAGTLNVATGANLGSSGGTVAMSDATTLGLTGSNTFAQALQVAGTSTVNVGSGVAATWSGLVSDSASAGTLQVAGGGLFALTNAANSYTGGTNVIGNSTLAVSADGALGAAGAGLTLGDTATQGTLALTTAGAFGSSRGMTIGQSGGAIDTASTTAATLSGVVGGLGSLTKTGTGALTLSGANTFSGGLFVKTGTLNVAADANLGGAGAVNLGDATTLGVTSTGAFAHALQLAGTSTVNVGTGVAATWSGLVSDGASAGILRLTGGGSFALSNAANSYTGGTSVAGGSTLLVGSDNVMGAAGAGLSLGDATTGGTLGLTTAGAFSSTRAITLGAGGGTIDTASTTTAALSGIVGGTGGFTKTGTGVLTLSGANTFTGGVTINAGTLFGSTTSLLGDIVNNAQLGFDQTVDGTFSGAISGTGGVTKAGAGALTLSGANTFAGGLALAAGTVNASSDANLGTGAVSMSDATTLGLSGGGTFTRGLQVAGTSSISVATGQTAAWSGIIADNASAGILQLTGGGTLSLGNAANSYTGGTSVIGGSTLLVGADGALGSAGAGLALGDAGSTATLGITTPGAFLSSRAITLGAIGATIDTAGTAAATLSGAIDGSGALIKTGNGTLTLAGTNTFAGGLTLSAGGLNVSADANLGGSGAVTLGDATTLGITGSGVFAHDVLLGGTSTVSVNAGQSVTWNGQIGDVGPAPRSATTAAAILPGSGTLRLAGGGTFSLTNTANWYSNGTIVVGGTTLQIGADSVLGAAGSSLSLGDATSTATLGITTAGLFASTRSVTLGAGGGTIDTASTTDATLGGTISGAGGLIKSGAGVLTLTGANTFTGGITITGGTLVGSTTSLLGNIVNNSQLGFNQAAAGTYGGVISGTGSVTKSGAGALTLSGTNTFAGGLFVKTGTLNVGADANLGGAAGAVAMSAGTTIGLTTTGTFAHALQVAGTSTVNVGTGVAATWSGLVSNNAGAGTLQVTGGGLFALTNAANSYTGGTSVVGNSTLSVGADGALGAAGAGLTLGDATSTGTLALTTAGTFVSVRAITLGAGGGTIDTASTTAATLSAVIGGTGGLTKAGAGSLTLSGANTYAGPTTVSAGTLLTGRTNIFGSSATLSVASGATVNLNGFSQTAGFLSGTGTLALGQGAIFTLGGNNASTIFSGTISGTGGLVKNGTGQLTLLGTNTFTGGIAVTGGTLSGNTASLLGNIVNNAQLVFDQASAGTYSGAVSGTGSLVKNGAGRLTLTGANAFTGGTTVNAGGLWGTTASVVGNIVNNAQVGFDQTTNGAYSGVMSGTGSLFKTGTGALTLTGANTFTGGTFLNGGSIIASTTSLQGTVVDNSQLIFNQGFDGLFRGLINGIGALTKLGTGTLSLSGPQGFTGLTWIREGALAIDTGLAGNVIVDAGASLLGFGTIGGSLNLAGSLLVPAPGSQFAPFTRAFDVQTLTAGAQTPVLTINGNLTTTPGSTINLTLSPGTPVPLLVNGTATLVGTHFSVNFNDPNPVRSSTYNAISAVGGLQISGGDITSPSSTLVPVFHVGPSALAVTLLNLSAPLVGVATTPNAVSAGVAMDASGVGATGDFGFVRRELTALSDPKLDFALRELSGEIHASAARMIVLDGLSVTDMVRNELSSVEHDTEERPATGGWAVRPWFQLSGDHSQFTSGQFSGGTANVGGGGGGLDVRPSSSWTAGVGISMSVGDLSLSDLTETSRLKAPRVFTYYGFGFGPFHVHWGGSLSRAATTTKRTIQFAALVPDASGQLVPLSVGVDRVATSDQVATTRDAWSDWQFTRKFGTWTFDGKLGLRVASYTRQAFGEAGADSISLDVANQTLSTREFNIDIHHFRHAGTWRPNIWVTYRRDFGESWTRAGAAFAGAPTNEFEIQGMPVPRDTFQGLFGITMRSRAGIGYTLEYQFMRNSDETRQSFRFKVRL